MNMFNLVKNVNGVAMTNSRIVADKFGKNHKDVIKAVKNLGCSDEFGERNIAPSTYKSKQNKELPEYLLTKDGFAMVCFGFTGAQAIVFKELYISEFNRMIEYIKDKRDKSKKIKAQEKKEIQDNTRASDAGSTLSKHKKIKSENETEMKRLLEELGIPTYQLELI